MAASISFCDCRPGPNSAAPDLLPHRQLGRYEILPEEPTGGLMLRKLDSGKPIMVPFTTRLAKRDGDQNALVFDKVGDQYHLSEIHLRCAGVVGTESRCPGQSARRTQVPLRRDTPCSGLMAES